MPLYEYECEKCGDHFEVIEKFTAEPLKVHEKCGGPVHRLLSAPALQFKGSGWYITDYAKSNSSSGSSSNSNGSANGSAGSAEKSAAKTDSTPASTPASSTTDK
jgi:putative FmdB family regulatory protein